MVFPEEMVAVAMTASTAGKEEVNGIWLGPAEEMEETEEKAEMEETEETRPFTTQTLINLPV